MNDATAQASEQALFAAREFIARYERETGTVLAASVGDFARFAYEMGYLRGRSDAAQAATKMFGDISHVFEEERKGNDDDTE